ncbi:THO complex subunit 2 [Schistosoma japonicum]|nr:THO complex subunit 2 [Schistosoma japonicum]
MEHLLAFCSNPIFATSCLKDWEKFGRKNFLTKCKEGGMAASVKLFTDLVLKLISGEGKIDILVKLIPELFKLFGSYGSFESDLLDSLWLIDSSIADINSESVRDRFYRLMEILKNHMNPALIMERFCEDTLENLSLIQSKQQFQTRYVRTKTRLFFKQQKFNLLREENEGYAKLITELCQIPPAGSMEAVMTQIRSLIGYFDLDPNRVLDLILDVCEFRGDMYEEFVQLLRLYNPDKIDMTNVLGHKYHFTQELGINTPESLYKVSAFLIWKKLVDLDVLYGHLTPSDADIQQSYNRQINLSKSYRPQPPASLSYSATSAVNTSLNTAINNDLIRVDGLLSQDSQLCGGGGGVSGAGALVMNGWTGPGTSAVVNSRSADELMQVDENSDVHLTKTNSREVGESMIDLNNDQDGLYENNQKLELCAAMIRLGDWTNARRLLERLPGYWATTYEPLTRDICNLLHCLIEPLYNKVCPLPACLQRNRSQPKIEMFKALNSSIKLNDVDERSSIDCEMDEEVNRSNENNNDILFSALVHDFVSLARHAIPIAIYLGPHMSYDLILMVKFCRLGQIYLSEQQQNLQSDKIGIVYQGFFNLLDEVLLPSLSLVDANCCLAEEIWQMLRFMPYEHRYRLYGQWKHFSAQTEPSLIRRRAQVMCYAKAIMKRLSKENVKPMGRHLGKLSHSNPGLLFDHVLHTVQLFTNLINPVVEALKYVSSLGYDMLTFCIIEALASDQSKLEDLQLSQGLQALSSFTGLLCRKYQFDLAGLLQYVLNQLKVGKSYDLAILREILHRMSGIDISEEMTDEQLESMSGGELLLQEGGYYAQIRNTRRNAGRLKEALIEHNLIMPFIFLMAQQRDAIIFLDDPERHCKLAGRLYDQCQGTLVQFITFLSLQLTREEMQTQCLSIDRMMGEFHVSADTAFCFHRNLFEQKVARLFEIKERAEIIKSGEKSKSLSKTIFSAASLHVCNEIAAAIRPLYPPRVWDELGIVFFVTFWSLQSSDLVVPESAYQRQIQQLKEQIHQIDTSASAWNSAKKKREIERLENLIERLNSEQAEREEHVTRVRTWLMTERDSWFQTRLATKTDTITQFLQLCIYPRVCFTAADAIYSAQFMHVLHQLKTARFSTLICLDRIFNDITLPTSMCTEDEAHRYGRFLCAVLELVMRWHASEEVFNQECGQYPGFVTVFRKTYQGLDANTKPDQLQYENYRHVVHKWHYRITKAIVACLESGNYVQIRNALIVLTRILPQYPKITQFGSAVERRVNKLKEEEKDKRPDLKALAFSYAGLMRPRKAKWVSEEEFHLKETKPMRSESNINYSGNHQSSTGNTNRTLLNPDNTIGSAPGYGHNPRGHPVSNQITNSSIIPSNPNNTGATISNVSSGSVNNNTTSVTGNSNIAVSSTAFEPPHISVSVRRSTINTPAQPLSQSSKIPSNSPTVLEARSRPQATNTSVTAAELPKSNPTVQPSGSVPTSTGATTNSISVSNMSSNSPSTITQSKLRSSQRLESSLPAPDDSIATVPGSQIHSSKRRRMEVANSNSIGSNGCVLTITTSKASANVVDETRESHKSSARKRSTPTTMPGSTPISSENAVQNLRYTNVNITANTTCNLSSNNPTGGSSGTSSRSTTSPGDSASLVNSSRHHHQSRQSSHQRASSCNSAESREPSLENERILIASSSAGLVKKSKKGHHHHHHQRSSLDSLNMESNPNNNNNNNNNNPNSVTIFSTSESQGSSRHSRR